MLLYPAKVIPDGQTYVVLFPDIPHTHTNGSTVAEALSRAPDALQTGLSMLMEQGLDIPAPGRPRGRNPILVGLPSVIATAKVELYTALRVRGVKKAELARRMGIHKQQIERLMDIDHASRIEQLEAAFAALGMKLTVQAQAIAA
jgi:antitoxin HicB